MAFKIKDGVRIGNVDVFNNAGALLVNAPTATVLANARTIAISGAVTGTATSFDGSANITISATALAAGNLSGTIPSAVLGASTAFIGTTSIALNRASAAQTLTGISIDGNAATVTNGVVTTGSYADPAWITSLAKSKVGLANVENTALSTWAGSSNITTIGAATATSLVVSGNLTVNGTTTTVNSTTVTLDDPIITLGGDTAPASDDSKDRGVEFRWHNGTVAKIGFFGFDDSTGKFTFIPDATNASEVFSGTKGTIDANIEWADILNKPAVGTGSVTSVAMTVPTGLTVSGSPITTSGTLAVTLTAGYSIPTTASQTNWDTAFTERNRWDGGATSLVAATGRTSLGATTVGGNLFTLTNPGAITFLRVNADNTVSALDAANFRTAIGAGTSSTVGTVTSVGGTGTVAGLTLTGTVTASGNLTLGGTLSTPVSTINDSTAVGQNLVKLANPSAIRFLRVNADNSVSALDAPTFATAIGAVTSLTDNLQTVTGRSNVTTTNIQLNGSAVVLAVSTTPRIYRQALTPANITVNTAVAIDTWATATYRSAKYTIQVTQGGKYQVSELRMIHDGNLVYLTEFSVLETNSAAPIPVTFTAVIATGTLTVNATVTDAFTTAASVIIERTLTTV
jgi:hypothetical protein